MFLVVALLRMLFSIALPPLLVCFYAVIFILAFFVPKEFLSVAFDSGGVTTGPMTVPFIMALGVGISATRSDRHAADDSFGLVALCSIGPILAVMMLGLIYKPGQRGVYASCNPGNRRFKAVVEPVCGRASHIYERNRTVPASDRAVFCSVPGIDPEAFGQKPDENPDRSGLYLYRSGTVFDRRKRRLYAGGQLSGTGAGRGFTIRG